MSHHPWLFALRRRFNVALVAAGVCSAFTIASGRAGAGTYNILDILKWIQNTKGWMSNETLGNVQFGWEITTENPGQNFMVNSYSVSFG